MRAPFELGWSPSAASITPAFAMSSLNAPIAATSSLLGRTPASERSPALTSSMNRILVSLLRSDQSSTAAYAEVQKSATSSPPVFIVVLAARHRTDDQEGLLPGRHGVGQWRVGRFLGQVLLAGEEPDERPAPLRHVITDRPAQHRVARLERVEDRTLRDATIDVERHLAVDARQLAQMRRENDPDHGSVCTSTDRTAGRSRTIGAHVSPESGDP